MALRSQPLDAFGMFREAYVDNSVDDENNDDVVERLSTYLPSYATNLDLVEADYLPG